jgi:DNA mismatch repair protein MutL
VSRIRVLSENVSNRIAAGEVIERPASVVKELVENSIDAGATRISITIEKAGKKLIAVADNGMGMDSDDALLCLEPHATSKIAAEEDIININSFGFRGEAIPSIASVSRLTLRTRTQEQMEGNEIVIQGGKVLKVSPLGCAPGTEFLIRDLFFNTPARKKFLRTDATEEKHIQETIYMLALPHPYIAFDLVIDGRKLVESPAYDDLMPRLQHFFGKGIKDQLMPVAITQNGVKVSGYVARHGITRTSRREQRIFVNGRPVDALPVYRGIREGFGSLVEKGRFPPAVLFITIDPTFVDVNVHPAKREVRFRNEGVIVAAVRSAISMALRHTAAPTISVDPNISLKMILNGAEVGYTPKDNQNHQPKLPGFATEQQREIEVVESYDHTPPVVIENESEMPSLNEEESRNIHTSLFVAPTENRDVLNESTPVPVAQENIATTNTPALSADSMRIIGFIDKTYILAEAKTGLVVIDQHAAHERVMYERILGKQSDSGTSQQLLLPITLELSRSETFFVEKNQELFSECGFGIEAFGQDTVIVNMIPAILSQDNIGGVIKDIIVTLMDDGSFRKHADIHAIAKAACGAAVKAHDNLTFQEAQALLQQMSECELPYSCPHGRPTIITITIKELEKRFGRR